MKLQRTWNATLVLAIAVALVAPGTSRVAGAAAAPISIQQSAIKATLPGKPDGKVNQVAPRVYGETDPHGTTPAVYIVQLTGAPLASYRGTTPGLPPTSPSMTGASLTTTDAASAAYLAYLGSEQAAMLAKIEQELGRPVEVVFTYAVAFNGMALVLTPAEAERVVRMTGVKQVERDLWHSLKLTTVQSGLAPPCCGTI